MGTSGVKPGQTGPNQGGQTFSNSLNLFLTFKILKARIKVGLNSLCQILKEDLEVLHNSNKGTLASQAPSEVTLSSKEILEILKINK
jgi:hypothetical protein